MSAFHMNATQREVLRAFRQLRIRFLVVGGQAMRAYGIDRITRDLDLWIARDLRNAERITQFMRRAQNVPPLERLQQPNLKFTVGAPDRPDVDILTSVAGDPSFDDCLARAEYLSVDGTRLPVIAAIDLLAVKHASAEKMDEDRTSPILNAQEQVSAQRTAAKERRDIMLLQLYLSTQPNSA